MTAQEDLAVLRHPVGHWDWAPEQTAPYGAPGEKAEVLYRCLRAALPGCSITIAWAPNASGEVEYTISADLRTTAWRPQIVGEYRVGDDLICTWDRPISRLAYMLAHLMAQALVKDKGR